MHQKLLSVSLITASIFALASCDHREERCSVDRQTIRVDFETRTLGLLVGEERTLESTVTPEICRAAIQFSVENGSLPPGMSLLNGNVTGMPTVAGTYRFQVSVSDVDGHPPFPESAAQRSSVITLVVDSYHADED